MKWILIAAAAWIAYVVYRAAQSGQSASDAAWNALANPIQTAQKTLGIPITTGSGLSGYLQSDGTIDDEDGNQIGMINSSGPRPGEAGGVVDLGVDP